MLFHVFLYRNKQMRSDRKKSASRLWRWSDLSLAHCSIYVSQRSTTWSIRYSSLDYLHTSRITYIYIFCSALILMSNYTPIFFNSTGTRIQQKYYITHQNFIPSLYPVMMPQLVGSVFERTPPWSTQPSNQVRQVFRLPSINQRRVHSRGDVMSSSESPLQKMSASLWYNQLQNCFHLEQTRGRQQVQMISAVR